MNARYQRCGPVAVLIGYVSANGQNLTSIRRDRAMWKTYKVDYNLDVIISVGYLVKSLRGTQFRISMSN